LYVSFNNYDFQKGTGFYFYANGGIVEDAIVSDTEVDADNIRTTTFSNVNGTASLNLHMGLNKSTKIDSLRSLKYHLGFNGNLNRNVSFNNNEAYGIQNNSFSPNVGLTLDWKKVLQIRTYYSISLARTSYENDIFQAQTFQNHNVNIFTALYLPEHFEWSNTIDYNYNPDITPGFTKSAWFWNSTLAYSFLKDKATVTAKVYDLLKQNTNARRTATQNYIQDAQSIVLQQYFMLSLSYKFNSLGSKGETRDGGNWMH
jgi:hypothetical protein